MGLVLAVTRPKMIKSKVELEGRRLESGAAAVVSSRKVLSMFRILALIPFTTVSCSL